MECDTIAFTAFTVFDDASESVWTYGMDGLQYLSSVFFSLLRCLLNARIGVQVDQWALVSHVLRLNDQASTVAFIVFKDAKSDVSELLDQHFDVQCLGVEVFGTVQILDRDVDPNGSGVGEMLSSLMDRAGYTFVV